MSEKHLRGTNPLLELSPEKIQKLNEIRGKKRFVLQRRFKSYDELIRLLHSAFVDSRPPPPCEQCDFVIAIRGRVIYVLLG